MKTIKKARITTRKKYTKKDYGKYIQQLKLDKLPIESALPFREWKKVQPIADEAVGLMNDIIL